MAVTKEDLRDFHRFADEKLDTGQPESVLELASEWEAQRREMEAATAELRESHADIDAGKASSVEDTFANVRNQLGLG